MKIKTKIVTTLMLVFLCLFTNYYLQENSSFIQAYGEDIYNPIQSFRGFLFDSIPFSIGDLLYIIGGVILLTTIIKIVYYLVNFKDYRERVLYSILNVVNTALFIYLLFIAGWGANYYQQPLANFWQLSEIDSFTGTPTDTGFKQKTKGELIAFDTFLVNRLNEFAPHYGTLPILEINSRASEYYKRFTDSKLKNHGLNIKPTFFGYFLERLAIEGYYNPLTGEGQVNYELPAFSMPFIICHEMAHQAGIAAEGDANLMAYAVGTATMDSTFNYSCYLEIWLYINRKLYYLDSTKALQLENQLNVLTVRHLDTLEALSKKYDNNYARYSSELFDTYLKLQDQKEGIRSYSNVASSAWLWEQRRKLKATGIIKIP